MTANEELRTLYTRRQIDLSRYSAQTVRRILRFLDRVEADTLSKLNDLPPSGRRSQLEAFLAELRLIYAEAYRLVTGAINAELQGLATAEAEFGVSAIERAALGGSAVLRASVQKSLPQQIWAAVEARPFEGRFLRDWLVGLEDGAAGRVRDAIRIGYVEGESISAIKARVRRIIPVSRRGADAMVRTAVNHTAQAARSEVFKANGDLIQGEMWNALLDSRTTLICQSRDGDVFPVGEGPRPPAHIRCRSYMSPVLRGIPPPDRTSYEEWLRKQPASVQDDILGKAKGRAFRQGLSIDKFVDPAGKGYTLDELRARHSKYFED